MPIYCAAEVRKMKIFGNSSPPPFWSSGFDDIPAPHFRSSLSRTLDLPPAPRPVRIRSRRLFSLNKAIGLTRFNINYFPLSLPFCGSFPQILLCICTVKNFCFVFCHILQHTFENFRYWKTSPVLRHRNVPVRSAPNECVPRLSASYILSASLI